MDHMSLDRIMAYLKESLSFEDSLEFDEHVATCQTCAGRIRILLSVREHFDELWDSWSLKTHAAEFALARVAVSICEADARECLKTRILQWSDRIQDGVEAALSLTVDASKRFAGVFQEGLDFLQPDIDARAFSLTPSPVMIQGDHESPPWIAVEALEPSWAKMTVDPALGRVLVQLQNRERPWPLVALVAKDGGWSTVDIFREPDGEDFLLAEFEDVPSGEFFMIIEKLPVEGLPSK